VRVLVETRTDIVQDQMLTDNVLALLNTPEKNGKIALPLTERQHYIVLLEMVGIMDGK